MNETEKIYVEKSSAFEATRTGLWQVGADYFLIKKIVDFRKEIINLYEKFVTNVIRSKTNEPPH